MSERVTILSWDQSPSPKLEKLVHAEAARLFPEGTPAPRIWVWLERRRDDRGRVHNYARLDAEVLGGGEQNIGRVRVESTGDSPEESCRRAFRALTAASPAALAIAGRDARRAERRPPKAEGAPASPARRSARGGVVGVYGV